MSISHPLHISSDAIPDRDKRAFAYDVFGQEFLSANCSFEGMPEIDMHFRALQGLWIVKGTMNDHKAWRGSEHRADGIDDVFVLMNRSGAFSITQRGNEVVVDPGAACFVNYAEDLSYKRRTGNAIGLRVPRAALEPLVRDLDHALASRTPANIAPLRLAGAYMSTLSLFDKASFKTLTENTVTSHIHDLIALSMGSSRDKAGTRSSVGAARLRVIKRDVAANIWRHTLTADTIAAWHGINKRTLHRLFERDGVTVARFIQEQRLLRAHSLLSNPDFAGRKVGDIAKACGFNDVPNFNLAFRKRFGASPTDIRATAPDGI